MRNKNADAIQLRSATNVNGGILDADFWAEKLTPNRNAERKSKNGGKYFLKVNFIICAFVPVLKLVLGTDFDADAANAASANILEMFLHVLRAFFGVVVAFAVDVWQLAKDRTSRAGKHAFLALATAVFNNGQLAF